MAAEHTSPSTTQDPPARPWKRATFIAGTGGVGLALLIGWLFSGSTGAGTDAAHASAAEGYGLTPKAQDDV